MDPVGRMLLQTVEERNSDRDTEHIHPSAIAKALWCPRQTWYQITGQEKTNKGKPLSFRMENIFAEGHDIHDKWQRWLWALGVLYGAWQCRDCDHFWFALAPEHCQKCQSTHLRYREVPLVNGDHDLLGHGDGLIVDDLGRALIEIKSIGLRSVEIEAPALWLRYVEEGWDLNRLWREIRYPFPSHLRQGNLYLYMAQSLGIDVPEIVFLYESKFNQAVKEFTVRVSSRILDPLLEGCRTVIRGQKSGFPPERPDWATDSTHPECGLCHYKNDCWGITRAKANPTIERPVTVRVVRRVGKSPVRAGGSSPPPSRPMSCLSSPATWPS